MAWVALPKSLPEFVYFAVEICHCGPLPIVLPQVFPSGKNFVNRQNVKDAVMLGWGRQIFEKLSQTIGITGTTVNACQCNTRNDTHGKFNSSPRSFIMKRRGFLWPVLTYEFP